MEKQLCHVITDSSRDVGMNVLCLGLFCEVGAGCRFDLGKTALAAVALARMVNESENLVTDAPKYAL